MTDFKLRCRAFELRGVIRVHDSYFIIDFEVVQQAFVYFFSGPRGRGVHTKIREHVFDNKSYLLTLYPKIT